MENTVAMLAKVLGARGIESAGGDARFVVEGASGERLRVSIEGEQQRFMAVLNDGQGIVRCSIDIAPVTHVTQDHEVPGRVTLHVGQLLIHVDSKPTLAIEIASRT
jgi:hypothetical protein